MVKWLTDRHARRPDPVYSLRDVPDNKKDRFTHPHLCSRCPERFTTPSSLTRHITEKHTQKPTSARLVCQVCGYGTVRSTDFKRHLRTHSKKPERWECRVCAKVFGYKRNLQRHIKQVHTSRPKKYECKLCTYSCDRKDVMRRHRKDVHKVKVTPMKQRKRRKTMDKG